MFGRNIVLDTKIEQELEVIQELPEYRERDYSDFEAEILSNDDDILAAELSCMKLDYKYESKLSKNKIRMEIENKGICSNTRKIKKR